MLFYLDINNGIIAHFNLNFYRHFFSLVSLNARVEEVIYFSQK